MSAAGDGMDEAEQDQHEARLKELFDSFDTTGTGSLGQEELTDLCHMLSLEEVAPVLQETLLQDNLLGRVRPVERRAVGSGCGFCAGAGGEGRGRKPQALQLVSNVLGRVLLAVKLVNSGGREVGMEWERHSSAVCCVTRACFNLCSGVKVYTGHLR